VAPLAMGAGVAAEGLAAAVGRSGHGRGSGQQQRRGLGFIISAA
jgi:hypothetical protein